MKLVVDTNILVSFFKDNPVRKIIINANPSNLQLFSPKYALKELKQNMPDIIKYSKLSSKQVEFIINKGIGEFIILISSEEFEQYNKQAKQLFPHSKDDPFFALALKLDCPIWSNEPEFKQQSEIRIFSTREMIELFT